MDLPPYFADPYDIRDFHLNVSVRPNVHATVNVVNVMRVTRCVKCDGILTDAACLGVGFPWNGLVHRHCFLTMRFDRTWPHPQLLAEYVNRAETGGSTQSPNRISPPLRTSLGSNEI
jgi:hypothetical protein